MPKIELFLEDLILKDQFLEDWQNWFQIWVDFLQPDLDEQSNLEMLKLQTELMVIST